MGFGYESQNHVYSIAQNINQDSKLTTDNAFCVLFHAIA